MQIRSLHLYPVKSVRGIDINTASVKFRGLADDRRWVVADDARQFLTQRECSSLAKIIATPKGKSIKLQSQGIESVIDVSIASDAERNVIRVGRDDVDAVDAGADAADWLSSTLGRSVRLFYMDDKAARSTSGVMAASAPVSFADGYPVLIVTASSLDALNQEIVTNGGEVVPMSRFRPNIVVEDTQAWRDDYWQTIKIGDVTFDLVKPCDRCVVTTKDQISGATMGKEPLRSLARIRRSADSRVNGVLFGWNAIPRNEGSINIGDAVEIIETRPEGWPLAPLPA